MKPDTLVAILAGWATILFTAPAPAADGSAEMTFTNGQNAPITFAPALAMKGRPIRTDLGAKGIVRIVGQDLAVEGAGKGKTRGIGLDCDGDGQIDRREWKTIPPSRCVRFTGKVGEKEFTVDFFDTQVNTNPGTDKAFSLWGLPVLRSGMTGKIDGVPISIFDNDGDGQFRGGFYASDTILIGKSIVAMPLGTIHQIGEHRYKLKVAPDGTRIDYQQLPDVPCGTVQTRFPAKMVTALVLQGTEGTYDAAAGPIPAGTYTFYYGVLGKNTPIFFRMDDGRMPEKYEIQADKINTLKLGPPLQIKVRGGQYKLPAGNQVQNMVTVSISEGNDLISGCGGETYGPFHFTDKSIPPPVAAIRVGSQIISSGPMRPG